MNKYFKIIIFCVVLLVLFLIKGYQLRAILFSYFDNRKVMIGVWNQGFWNNDTKQLDTSEITEFEKNIGKNVAIAHYFKGWDELGRHQTVSELNSISENGWVPMISTNPYHTENCLADHVDVYSSIAMGKCDELIHSIAATMREYGKPVLFRFAWEMNIETMSWSVLSTYSTAESFIAAWRHVHDIFIADGATNVLWVFSVNVESESSVPVEYLYPGDKYVDWIAIDGYNWGTTQSWSKWQSFDEVFRSTYEKMLVVAPNKPLMISETNSANEGGNKSHWLVEALDVQIPNNYPEIDAIIFFNEDKTKAESVDWRIEKSESVMQVMKASLSKKLYSSSTDYFYKKKDEQN